LLVVLVGWQALFAINVPLTLAALIGVRLFAPDDVGAERGRFSELVRDSDLPGILGFVGSLTMLMMALLNVLPDYRWWLLAGSIVLAALFILRELRFSPPFLDVRLLARNRALLLVYICFVVFNGVYYFAFFGLPQLLQEAAGYDAGLVGLLMLPLAAFSVVSTPLAVRGIERYGVRSVLLSGAVLLTAASAALWLLTASFALPLVLVLTALLGLPYGMVSTASNQGLYLSARPEERGVAAGVFQTCRYLGAISSTVMIGVFYSTGVNQESWGQVVAVMLGLGVLVVVLSLFWREREPRG
jgi:predicted MFS family arabinose efflux permease